MALQDSYTEDGGGEAGAALGTAPKEGMEPEAEQKDSFYLPSDMPGMDTAKAGDILSFKVVGKTSDGEIEVEKCDPEKPGKSMKDDPEWAAMASPDSGPQETM